jgi:hypothetical protein
MNNIHATLLSGFQDELTKIANARMYGGMLLGGGAVLGADKAKKLYSLAKKEEREQEESRNIRKMQAIQARAALRKQYGAAFSEQ